MSLCVAFLCLSCVWLFLSYRVFHAFWGLKNRQSFSPRKVIPILKKGLNRSWSAVFLCHQFFISALLNMPTMYVWRKQPYPACIFNPDNYGQKNGNYLFVSVSHPSNKKNIAKSMTILKLCERSFQWDLAGCHISIRLEMAEEWRQVVKNLESQ